MIVSFADEAAQDLFRGRPSLALGELVMRPTRRTPTHPGKILLLDFLAPMGRSQMDLARHLNVPIQRINEVVRGRRGVSAETAWLLSQAFGTTPAFWMNLQVNHDLVACKPKRSVRRLQRAK